MQMKSETLVWEGKIQLVIVKEHGEHETEMLTLTDTDFDIDKLCEGLLALNSFKNDMSMLQTILDSTVGILERKKAEIISVTMRPMEGQ